MAMVSMEAPQLQPWSEPLPELDGGRWELEDGEVWYADAPVAREMRHAGTFVEANRGGASGGGEKRAGDEGEGAASWCKQLQYTLMPWTALDYNRVVELHGWYRCAAAVVRSSSSRHRRGH